MKFFVATLLTALLAFVGGFWFDWWIIAIAAFVAAILVHQKAGKAFLAGFAGGFILWGAMAYWIDMQNEGLLSKKVSKLLSLGDHPFLLICVSAIVAALVAGFGAMSGSYLRSSK
jgi:phosphotransferase system  glucose/maltose/N-acetylglucosamine-specific IIC component